MKKCILFLFMLLGISINVIAQVQPIDTDGDGYINISTLAHLRWVSEKFFSWDKNFELDCNINAAATANWNAGAGFSPIGIDTLAFTGKFEGHGFVIDSLYINRPETDYIGLVGKTKDAEISNLGIKNCRIVGKDFVGGLVGKNYQSIVRTSYTTGSISGIVGIGGLVGVNETFSTISSSYSMGMISGRDSVGGLVGTNLRSMISNSYSTGRVSGLYSVGGLVGNIDSNYTRVINSFWDTQTSGQSSSATGLGKTTAEMQNISTFISFGWNFKSIWLINPTTNNGYPYIDVRGIIIIGNEPKDKDGDGYRNISCYSHLHWISQNDSSWSWNYKLDNNIDADSTWLLSGDDGFSPIGNMYKNYTGKFEGNGFIIDSLYINRPGNDNIGLFGSTKKAEISNIGISNCHIIGSSKVGGLIGENSYSTVNTSYSMGSVTGRYNVGGLIGYLNYSMICNNYSTGNVLGVSNVGGLVGNSYSSSAIINCYSIDNVSGRSKVGGLTGVVTSTDVYNSFWDTQTSGIDTSAGGTGKSTAEMKTKFTFTSTGWNFNLVWAIDAAINNGYPYLNDRGITLSGIKPVDKDGDGYRNISCYSHLHWISQNDSSWSWNYELDNNINADTTHLLSGDFGFSPIGNTTIKFSGNFEGNNFVVDSIYINRPGNYEIGFFGKTQEAEISNVGIANCMINGAGSAGGLVGENFYNTTVNNCYSTGSIYSKSNCSGGLIGWNKDTKVSNCYSMCNVSGEGFVGGLIGCNIDSSIVISSYSTGSVSGSDKVGGLVGENYSSTVSNCYSMCNVSGRGGSRWSCRSE